MSSFLNTLIRNSNLFVLENFWLTNGKRSYSSICGALVSLPLVALIIILLLLKAAQMSSFGIVMSSKQIDYTSEPSLSSFTTSQSDAVLAPFMLAFSINTDKTSCPNSAITFELNSLEATGTVNTTNRTTSKIAINYESCTSDHFAMLPGKLAKLRQYTNRPLFCLPLNSQFHLGGYSSLSSIYKALQFRIACPSSCNSSTCGTVELFSMSSTVNLQNSSSPFSYFLTRHAFQISAAPKYQVLYQIDQNRIISDNSVLPYSLKNSAISQTVGEVVTDIANPTNDKNNYITVQRSDKAINYQRSYYKVFDLISYLGGLVYCFVTFLFFLKIFSRIEFELNFGGQYLRVGDSKSITLRGYIKQLVYRILKHTRWRPDWSIARQRQESREVTSEVMDVIYLNKRITFLEDAISMLFEKHQLKGIYLLHTLNKSELQTKMQAHRFRDRLVFYLGQKYKDKGMKTVTLAKEPENDGDILINNQNLEPLVKSKEVSANTKKAAFVQQEKKESERDQLLKQKQICSLKELIKKKYSVEEKKLIDQKRNEFIINEAESYYSQLEEANRFSRNLEINNRVDNLSLRKELNFVGTLNQEELHQNGLLEWLKSDVKKLVEQAQKKDGNELSRKIYGKLDGWIKNYLWNELNTDY